MNVDMAERLAKRRRGAGLSQEALAERLGVSRQAVSKWERSESSPDTDNLIALAELYGVSLDDLLYAEPESDEPADGGAEAGASPEEAPAKAAGGADEGESADPDPAPADDDAFSIGPDGISARDGKDHVHISWRDGVHVVDGKRGDTVHVGWDGVHVNDRSFDTISSFHDQFPQFGHGPKPQRSAARAWMRFPFPVLALLAYLICGLAFGQWLEGLFLVFTIPLYYIIGTFIATRSLGTLVSGIYAIGALAWFCYMAFVLDQPHPAWVVLLTIPLVCALAAWATHTHRRAHKDTAA